MKVSDEEVSPESGCARSARGSWRLYCFRPLAGWIGGGVWHQVTADHLQRLHLVLTKSKIESEVFKGARR